MFVLENIGLVPGLFNNEINEIFVVYFGIEENAA